MRIAFGVLVCLIELAPSLPCLAQRLPSSSLGPLAPRPPYLPTDPDEPQPDFPFRVHLYTVRVGGRGTDYRGYGSGNVSTTQKDAAAQNDATTTTQGFDYTFACAMPFLENRSPADTYMARWTRPPYRIAPTP
jgi:hypothetical protein